MQALLIDLGWKSMLIAGAVLIACHALRGRAASERVLLLRLGVGALLALPIVASLAPSLELAVLPAEAVAVTAPMVAESAAAVAEQDAPGALDLILMLYCSGAALVLLRLSLGLLTLWRWTRTALPASDPHWTRALARAAIGIGRPVRLLVSRKVRAPLSWGVAPAWILIGPETEARSGQAEAVLAHEMAHVRRFDWPMLMLAQLATALLWFNPFVWWLGRTLGAQIELAADEAAVTHVARLDYAQTLLAVGAGGHRAACGMTYARGTLGRRIRDVLEAAPRRSASRLFCGAMLIAFICGAGPLAALKLVPGEVQAGGEPVVRSYLPAIIPQAQARDAEDMPKPVPQRRRKKAGSDARPIVSAPPIPGVLKLASVEPVIRLAPGTQQSREARKATRQANHEARSAAHEARRTARSDAVAEKPRFSPKDRGRALGMTEVAKGMRIKAQAMERIAADPTVPASVRAAHARTAGGLHRSAYQLDRDARQLIFKP